VDPIKNRVSIHNTVPQMSSQILLILVSLQRVRCANRPYFQLSMDNWSSGPRPRISQRILWHHCQAWLAVGHSQNWCTTISRLTNTIHANRATLINFVVDPPMPGIHCNRSVSNELDEAAFLSRSIFVPQVVLSKTEGPGKNSGLLVLNNISNKVATYQDLETELSGVIHERDFIF
jgi:hypothetical protein